MLRDGLVRDAAAADDAACIIIIVSTRDARFSMLLFLLAIRLNNILCYGRGIRTFERYLLFSYSYSFYVHDALKENKRKVIVIQYGDVEKSKREILFFRSAWCRADRVGR